MDSLVFFTKYGNDVCNAVVMFFRSSWLLPGFNSNFIVLIPKTPNADTITNFRPIALANFVFKIIPKLLADRISSIASKIISPNQTAFVKGRKIYQSIGLASECFNLLDNKTHGGNVALKVDIAKAFETIDWGFLLHVLDAFGFNNTFGSLLC